MNGRPMRSVQRQRAAANVPVGALLWIGAGVARAEVVDLQWQDGAKLQRVIDDQGNVLLYSHSPAREQKGRAIDAAKAAGFEAVLIKLQAGLGKPRGTKDLGKIMQRISRAQQRWSRAATKM